MPPGDSLLFQYSNFKFLTNSDFKTALLLLGSPTWGVSPCATRQNVNLDGDGRALDLDQERMQEQIKQVQAKKGFIKAKIVASVSFVLSQEKLLFYLCSHGGTRGRKGKLIELLSMGKFLAYS